MLIVKINPVTGFGKTAEFAGFTLMNYDLANKTASVTFHLYEDSNFMNGFILSKPIYLTDTEIADWGLDDMVLVDVVLTKEGLTRDTEWVEPTTTLPPSPEETTTTTTLAE